jgi:hypothetical protein
MRSLAGSVALSGLLVLLFAVADAMARPAAGPADDRNSVVIVFKDGHRQSFAAAEIARMDFKAPAVIVYKDGHQEKFLPSDIARIEFGTSSLSEMMPGRGHYAGKWEVARAMAIRFSSHSTPTERRERLSDLRTEPGLWSMERLASVGRTAGTT